MSWCSDISKAPRGKYVVVNRKAGKTQTDMRIFKPDRVILATKCGKVTLSHYLPEEKRWLMLAKGEEPVAWQSWPDHPHSIPLESGPSISAKRSDAGIEIVMVHSNIVGAA